MRRRASVLAGKSEMGEPQRGEKEAEEKNNMSLTYPCREQAMHYWRALKMGCGSRARRRASGEETPLAWPAGLDRRLLRGLPLPTHTRNCVLRSGLMEGTTRSRWPRCFARPTSARRLISIAINLLNSCFSPDRMLTGIGRAAGRFQRVCSLAFAANRVMRTAATFPRHESRRFPN